MKELIIGIDGGSQEIFSKMPMPYLNNLFDEFDALFLTEDLINRGWAEILSGEYAYNTKAFYVHPKLDGTHDFILKYNLELLLKNPDVIPIWDLAQHKGAKIGIMNVPTTFPAQKVDGFFVSGAGGGVNKVEGIPEKLCHPKSLAKRLEDWGYVIDLRMGTTNTRDIQLLFDRLNLMLEKRVDAFLELCSEHRPDFGFIAIRATTVVQYLAMSELEYYFSYKAGQMSEKEYAKHEIWLNNFEKHYQILDEQIKRLIEVLQPEHCILTSDHSIVPYRYQSNPNALLEKLGYQKKKLKFFDTAKQLLNSVFFGKTFRQMFEMDWDRTKAFSDWYSPGIYINDQERFNGPVLTDAIDSVVDDLCSDFNADKEAQKYEIVARPYRRLFSNARYKDFLPDIKLHWSDSIFIPGKHGNFIRPNEDWAPLSDLSTVKGGMHSGQKGRHPLFCCDSKTASLISQDDSLDLTLVYKLTERIFS